MPKTALSSKIDSHGYLHPSVPRIGYFKKKYMVHPWSRRNKSRPGQNGTQCVVNTSHRERIQLIRLKLDYDLYLGWSHVDPPTRGFVSSPLIRLATPLRTSESLLRCTYNRLCIVETHKGHSRSSRGLPPLEHRDLPRKRLEERLLWYWSIMSEDCRCMSDRCTSRCLCGAV